MIDTMTLFYIIVSSAAIIYLSALHLEHRKNEEVSKWNSTRK